jgi:hypothetical protein
LFVQVRISTAQGSPPPSSNTNASTDASRPSTREPPQAGQAGQTPGAHMSFAQDRSGNAPVLLFNPPPARVAGGVPGHHSASASVGGGLDQLGLIKGARNYSNQVSVGSSIKGGAVECGLINQGVCCRVWAHQSRGVL